MVQLLRRPEQPLVHVLPENILIHREDALIVIPVNIPMLLIHQDVQYVQMQLIPILGLLVAPLVLRVLLQRLQVRLLYIIAYVWLECMAWDIVIRVRLELILILVPQLLMDVDVLVVGMEHEGNVRNAQLDLLLGGPEQQMHLGVNNVILDKKWLKDSASRVK
jgi:hypothetical protein